MAKIITVSSQKGGVAKTATTVSLGAALAEAGHSVLLIDLDPQASLTVSFGVKPESLRRTITDAILGSRSLVGLSQESPVFALDFVPSNQELGMVDKVLYERPGYQSRLKHTLDRLDPGLYNYVLIDCPPSVGPLTQNALAAADLLIIPAQAELFAARSIQQTIGMAQQLKSINPGLIYRVLVTLYDMRNKISRLILKQMQDGLAPFLFKTIIQIDTKVRESPAFGKPITIYAPRSRATQQYRELALEVVELPLAGPTIHKEMEAQLVGETYG